MQRGGSPTTFDRLLGLRFGAAAVRALAAGHKGVMVALHDTGVEYVALADAIDATLAGRPAMAAGKQTSGCLVDFPERNKVAKISYAKDVAPILQQNCQVCHQPGAIGPMSLMSYDEVRPWAPVIKARVVQREMPPYHYDPHVGIQELQGDWRLSEEAIKTVVAWVDAGAPMGDPAFMPPPAEFPDLNKFRMEETFGRPPDVIISSTPYDVPGMGADRWWRPQVPSGITEVSMARWGTKPAGNSLGEMSALLA